MARVATSVEELIISQEDVKLIILGIISSETLK